MQQRSTGSSTMLNDMGDALLKQGLYGQAEALFSSIVTAFPENKAAWLGLGIARYYAGTIEDALLALHVAQALDQESLLPHIWKVECLIKQNKREDALKLLLEINAANVHNDENIKCHLKQLKLSLESFIEENNNAS